MKNAGFDRLFLFSFVAVEDEENEFLWRAEVFRSLYRFNMRIKKLSKFGTVYAGKLPPAIPNRTPGNTSFV